jgi:hypothetical protein
MGFDHIEFREELEQLPGVTLDRIGVPDDQLFARSSLLLREARGPQFHFLVTLTTHTPYTYIPAGRRELFDEPRDPVERYFNSMRYLDTCLRDYLSSLGPPTTVMIYGDHHTEVAGGGFRPDRDGVRSYVPCFLYDTSEDLSQRQRTRDQTVSRDGSLHLLDLITYLRGQASRSRSTR